MYITIRTLSHGDYFHHQYLGNHICIASCHSYALTLTRHHILGIFFGLVKALAQSQGLQSVLIFHPYYNPNIDFVSCLTCSKHASSSQLETVRIGSISLFTKLLSIGMEESPCLVPPSLRTV